jgi:hypothetical protein
MLQVTGLLDVRENLLIRDAKRLVRSLKLRGKSVF